MASTEELAGHFDRLVTSALDGVDV
jgi:hypothetical protein